MYGTRDAIYIGGGKKGFALCLQLDESRGFSSPCETFNSPSLINSEENFQCVCVEVWAFSGLKI
jgi:hypothetical protein